MTDATLIEAIDLPRAVARYAGRFHAVTGSGQHVASPLGAWLLLALCARCATGERRARLRDILGADPDVAAAWAGRLLENPHDAIGSAAGVWTQAGLEAERLAGFLASLPVSVERGGRMPTKPELDAWARERTFGLIDAFPVTPDERTSLLLATALVTRVRWATSFKVAPAAELGARSEWSRRLTRVLRTPNDTDHVHCIVRTERAGDVAVHAVWAREGVIVVSVIARSIVPADVVMATAHDVAIGVALRRQPQVSLYDLPLGDAELWSIAEVETDDPGQGESYSAVLPAWEARSDFELIGHGLGVEEIAGALAELAQLPLDKVEARQSAMARYTRTGFEAAAVTAMSVRFGRAMSRERGMERHARLRFGHPFAVVAVAQLDTWGASSNATNAWRGIPLFSAWITDPTDADEETPDPDDPFMNEDYDDDLEEGDGAAARNAPARRGILDRLRALFRRP